ncbi:MAG TPA: glucose-6-phosphate dehydrogenase [Stellaceae bacterium]|jgi:glucose-6-phosphate 1-dehydrogenase|nr:glucose-6-phosphate dehydrogenase [Stellaceae bacterium]
MAKGGTARVQPADPCTLVIFGASGDLTTRLLLPALYHLATAKLLPEGFSVIGVSRSNFSDEQFRRHVRGELIRFAEAPIKPKLREWFLKRISYLSGDFDDPATFTELGARLKARAAKGVGNRLFYLATPPNLFGPLAEQLGIAGFAKEERGHWSRLIVEKPFGTDYPSAVALNRRIRGVFAETQIYRIDHYLGKETVQNILALRFANGLFESIWNRDRIDHVQITVTETVNVEQRGRFYDAAGALRDMVPNHLFQLLSLIAMEPPSGFSAEAVRGEKTKALEAIRIASPEEAGRDGVRGQYGAGRVLGKKVVAYRKAPNVDRHSDTETYVALRLTIENWRWAGVPFYLRTGKALAARKTEIAIRFKEAPFAVFRDTPVKRLAQNFIVIRIAPDEGITIQFNAKVPGQGLQLEGVRMDFNYQDYFAAQPRNGYETLIYDCMRGDATLFQHAGDVEAAWRAVQPFLDAWRIAKDKGLGIYPAGSDGPVAADALLARDGRRWRPIVAKKSLAAPSTE